MTKRKLKPLTRNGIDQSVNLTQSGDNNSAIIHYQTPQNDDELHALRHLMEAQQNLIRVYQKRTKSDLDH